MRVEPPTFLSATQGGVDLQLQAEFQYSVGVIISSISLNPKVLIPICGYILSLLDAMRLPR